MWKVKTTRGKVANIFKVQSLDPDSLKAHLELYLITMFGKAGLSREQREIIAVAVSVANRCDYCIAHHSAALRKYVKDDDLIKQLLHGPGTPSLDPKDRMMVSYAIALTSDPSSVTEDHIRALRRNGMSDEEILQLALITSYFNFVNRLASGLGVSLEEDGGGGFRC